MDSWSEEQFDNEGSDDDELGEDDRELIRQDLIDVEALKVLLGPRNFKGVVFFCPDCEQDHFLEWDLLRGNLQELLDAGESPVHEPAFEPNPDEYVSWDYARGFLDGYETLQQEDVEPLVAQLLEELYRRGWRTEDSEELLTSLGVSIPDWLHGRRGEPGH
jgi:Family of unknown function (DUF5319)